MSDYRRVGDGVETLDGPPHAGPISGLNSTGRYGGLEYDYEVPDNVIVESPGGASSTHHHWTKGFYGNAGGVTNNAYGHSNPRYPYGSFGSLYAKGVDSANAYYAAPPSDTPYWGDNPRSDVPHIPTGAGYDAASPLAANHIQDGAYVAGLSTAQMAEQYPAVPLDAVHTPALANPHGAPTTPLALASPAVTADALATAARAAAADTSTMEYYSHDAHPSTSPSPAPTTVIIPPDEIIPATPIADGGGGEDKHGPHRKRVRVRVTKPVLVFLMFVVLYITLDLWSFSSTKFLVDKVHKGTPPPWSRFLLYALGGTVVFFLLVKWSGEPLQTITEG